MHRTMVAALVLLMMTGSAREASADPSEVSSEPSAAGFGKRASFLLALDNAVGISSERLGRSPDAVGVMGVFPGVFGPRIGLHGATSDGVTIGANVGLGMLVLGGGGSFARLSVAPRVGYAGSASPTFGYWFRGGPSLHYLHADGGGGGALLGAGFEGFAVITPVDHMGVLLGPTAELGLTGTDGVKYTSFGFSVGLVADL
jgi:hypothetical protein